MVVLSEASNRILNVLGNSCILASSAESVGDLWLGEVSELVKNGGFDRVELFETVRFSHGQFRFVEALDNI